MDYVGCDNFYIDRDALMIILAAAGMEKWYGFSQNVQEKDITTEYINKLLAGLYQEGYITWEDESVKVLEPLNSLVYIVMHSPECLLIKGQGHADICYFADKKALVLEYGKQDIGKIKFSLWNEKKFIEHLWEIELFPKEEIEADADEIADTDMVIATFQVADKGTGNVKRTMTVLEKGVYTYITVEKNSEKKIMMYNKQQCEDILKEWILMEG